MLNYQKLCEIHAVMPMLQVEKLRHKEVKTLTKIAQTINGDLKI